MVKPNQGNQQLLTENEIGSSEVYGRGTSTKGRPRQHSRIVERQVRIIGRSKSDRFVGRAINIAKDRAMRERGKLEKNGKE